MIDIEGGTVMTQDIDLFIESFYRENYQKLYIYAFSILQRPADAEVAVQEAFVTVCEIPMELIRSENPIGWMKKTVRYRALRLLDDRKRTSALLVALTALAPDVDFSAWDSSDAELILLCQSIVSKDEFDFFLRLASGAATFLEESARLNIKLPACYKRFERIRDKLQQAVGKYYKF